MEVWTASPLLLVPPLRSLLLLLASGLKCTLAMARVHFVTRDSVWHLSQRFLANPRAALEGGAGDLPAGLLAL